MYMKVMVAIAVALFAVFVGCIVMLTFITISNEYGGQRIYTYEDDVGGSIMPAIIAAVVLIVVSVVVFMLWRSHKRHQQEIWRVERKVEARDLILRADIELLMRARSPLLVQAIELRREQTGEHGHPESENG